jgi:hypothetical protein
MNQKASEPFIFYSRLHQWELTGLRADTISELLEHIKTAPGSCIYHHTHHFLQQHEFSVPAASNDFAYWVSEVLGDDRLGEQLSAINTVSSTSIRHLREQFTEVIEKQLASRPIIENLRAPEGESFYFMKSKSFIFSINQKAETLEEFIGCLRRVSLTSIYYHVFESRLRFEKETNDFSTWLSSALGEDELAEKIGMIEPYAYSLEGLRRKLIELCTQRLEG